MANERLDDRLGAVMELVHQDHRGVALAGEYLYEVMRFIIVGHRLHLPLWGRGGGARHTATKVSVGEAPILRGFFALGELTEHAVDLRADTLGECLQEFVAGWQFAIATEPRPLHLRQIYADGDTADAVLG